MKTRKLIIGAACLLGLASPTVTLGQPSPIYTMSPSTNLWDGRQTFTVTPLISNMAVLQAAGATNFTYQWTVDGVAVIGQSLPPDINNPGVFTNSVLTLLRSQGNGPVTLTLALSNGGTPVTNSCIVPVQQPPTDTWVMRTPDLNEVPVNNQFYARDNTGYGTIYYNGSLGGSPNSVFLNVFANGVLYTNLSQALSGGRYAFTARIKGGLVTYSVQFGSVTGGVTNTLNTVTNLVCGDAYIIEGQSNAATTDSSIGSELAVSPTIYSNSWIRSYGILGGGTTGGWGYATRYDIEPKISYWGMDLASNLWATYNMPICIINGAVGGTMIVQHQANPANHLAATSRGDGIYANLLSRVSAAKLTHGIRGVLWHQGEQDQGTQQGLSLPDYVYYQKYFVNMSAAWKQDYPNIQNYYIFQIWPAACGDQADNDMLREVQRTLPRLYSNMRIMSTLGIVPGSGCHYVPAGYQRFSDLISPLVQQDNYGFVPANDITAPDLKQAYYTTPAKNEVALIFNQNMVWGSTALNRFFMDYVTPFSPGAYGKVVSGSSSGNVVKLQLSGSAYQTITYLAGSTWANSQAWDGVQNNLLYGSNGIAALTFCSAPIQSSASPSLFSLPANSLTTTSAVINATLGCGGTNFAVNAYWNTLNGGTSPGLWTNSAYAGAWTNVTSTNVSCSITGLLTGTTYYFSFEGTNASGPAGNLWPYNAKSFTTLVGAPGPVVDNNPGAANLALGVSQLRGTLANAPANIDLYWGTQDYGTSQANWANLGTRISLTNQPNGTFSITVSNLHYGLTYYYRSYAFNALGVAWSPTTASFTSMAPATPASLTNVAATGITGYSATLNAVLSCPDAVENVIVYWGTANGGTNAGAWGFSASLGSWTNVTAANMSYSAGGLIPATTYYCTFAATNALGALWATNVQSFTTPSTLVYSTLTSNGMTIVNFTNGIGPWTPPAGVTNVQVLVVGGGGGGGGDAGGGGGGGGVIYSNRFGVTGTVTVTVGNGGVGAGAGGNGQNSVFSSLTAKGGGGGAGWQTAASGGSGGGGYYSVPASGSGTAGQGNSGGYGSGYYNGSGGGGAGGAGMSGSQSSPYNGGDGGIGVQYSISGSTQWYAGGGGGGANFNDGGAASQGGNGGSGVGGRGGQGANDMVGQNGKANTGGGGGGSTHYYSAGGASAGGSGVVIITYSNPVPTVVIQNLPAASITTNSARLNATLACGSTNARVLVYWGTANGGTNPAAWANPAYVGSWTNVTSTNLGYTVTGLSASTTYYFTFRGTNAASSVWPDTPLNFTTPGPPTMDNSTGASNLSVGAAQLQGTLTNGPADVRFYWGAPDGGTNPVAWANSALIAGAGNGSVLVNVSNLLYGLTYSYRCCASNQWGAAWSPATASFTTLKPLAATAVQIPYSNMVEVSASSQYGGYWATNAFNGMGLQADGTHLTSGNWFSSGAAVTNEWLKVRFDQSYTLDHLRVWAFNAGTVNPAVTNADVYVLGSATDPAGNVNLGGGPFKTNGWSLLLPRQYLTPSASAATETNTDPSISLGGVTARQLALKINNVVSGTYAGFAEVQIYQSPPVLSLLNSAATGVGSASATLHATLGCTGAVYAVYAYWNTVNGGTSAGLWTNSAYVGSWTNLGSANLSYTAMGLAPATQYYFTFCATNAVDTLWAANVQSFTTLTPPPAPVVDNGAGATNLAVGVAQLRGTLSNGPADARFYWGTADGGTNFGLWTSDFGLPSVPSGGFSSNVSNLLYGLTYYYRGFASNQWGTAWAPATTNFTTLRPNSTLANSAATGLATNAAALHATLACTGAVYQVTAFWNTVNGGTDAALWPNSAYVGACTNVVSTNLSFAVANLLPNTAYYFTFRATNALDSLWATNVQTFTTLSPPGPVVDNGVGATNLAVGVAQLRGTLSNGPADARFYWGTADGGTNFGLWTSDFGLPSVPSGGFSSNVSNLLYGFTYYYRAYASNLWGTEWASATTNFTTLRPSSRLANSAATGVSSTAAGLNAALACTGAVYSVVVFWDTADDGTNATAWANSAALGCSTNVALTNLSFSANGLTPSTAYYFTFLATNALDTLWATNVQSFATLAATAPPIPVLPVSGVAVTNGVPAFTFTAARGCMYRLDYKNLLTDADWGCGDWSTNASGGDVQMTLTDLTAAGQPQRFYRLEAAWP